MSIIINFIFNQSFKYCHKLKNIYNFDMQNMAVEIKGLYFFGIVVISPNFMITICFCST